MASNFFDEVVNDAKSMEKKLLGPDYPYYSYIATPAELGMSDATGDLSESANNIAGMLNYIQLMVEGTGPANKNPNGSTKPMGDAFFLKTGGQCKDMATGKLVDRYLYMNNIPNGSIPFLTKDTGIQFTEFEGLIPGVIEDLGTLNPLEIMKGFMLGNNPPCQEIRMPTVGQPPGDITATGSMSAFVANADIENMAPCDWGKSGKNPITGVACKATFTTLNDMEKKGLDTSFRKKRKHNGKENYNNIYIFLCGLLLIYLVQKLMKKK